MNLKYSDLFFLIYKEICEIIHILRMYYFCTETLNIVAYTLFYYKHLKKMVDNNKIDHI